MPNPSMQAGSRRQVLAEVDLWIGVLLVGAGAFALYQAAGFDNASRNFPLIVAGLLTCSGLVLVLRCLSGGLKTPLKCHELLPIACAIGLLALWITALKYGLGFVISTFLMQLGLFRLAGERRILRAILIAALVSAASYLIFALVLDVRLPRSFLSFIATGL